MEKTLKKPRLTKKQKGFAVDYLKEGNATLAVKGNYNVKKDEVAASMGSELLRLPKVRQYIEDKSERAAEIIFELADKSENDTVRLNASKDILDRAGLKVAPEIPPESKGNVTYNFIQNTAIQADIKQMEEAIKAKLLGNATETKEIQ